MLNFLKKFFSSKEEEVILEVKRSELSQFLKDKLIEKREKANLIINETIIQADKTIKLTMQKIQELESANLKNDKIPDRHFQIMEGNRKIYCDKCKMFFKDQSFEGMDIDDFDARFMLFQKKLGDFTRTTARPYLVLQEFFANESRLVAIGFKELDTMLTDCLNELNKSEITKFSSYLGEIERINEIKKRGQEKKRAQKEIQELIVSLKEQISKKNNGLEEIKNSHGYKEYSLLLARNESLLSSQKALDESFHSDFSNIEKALKKFMHEAFNRELIWDYLKDPIEAIMNDSGSKFIEEIPKIAKMLNDGSLGIKDKKSDKSQQTLSKMTLEYFTEFIDKRRAFTRQIEEVSSQISSNLIEKSVAEQRKAIEELNKSLLDTQKEEAKIIEEISRIESNSNIKELHEKIEKEMKIKII
jgi:hypothetical protein